jgi:HSP20 family protein
MLRLNTRVSGTRTTGCRLDAHREDDTLHIDIELPGADPAGIDVTADGNVLTVRVARNGLSTAGGPATGQVVLDDGLDTDRMDARYDEGVLTLTIPVETKPELPNAA